MLKIGLTGSIGMGKTTTANMFREEGIPVYDADAAVHELYKNEAVEIIQEEFPEAIGNGVVDRNKLGKLVLGNETAIKKLESLIHPLVHKKELEFLSQAQAAGEHMVILDIPLLFETGRKDRVDYVIVVTASPTTQRKRVLDREGMNEEKFEAILQRQVPDSKKREMADYLVDTEKGYDGALEQVRAIISDLRKKL